MEFGILGPLSLIDSDGRSCAPGALKLKILLANFLVRPNRTMSTHQLIAVFYCRKPPQTFSSLSRGDIVR